MTAKPKKTKWRKARSRPRKAIGLQASVEDDVLLLAEEEDGAETRWNRPRKGRNSLRVDIEVVDWFKSKGPGYQTRINRILRRVMTEGKKRTGQEIGDRIAGRSDVRQVLHLLRSEKPGRVLFVPGLSGAVLLSAGFYLNPACSNRRSSIDTKLKWSRHVSMLSTTVSSWPRGFRIPCIPPAKMN